MPDSSTKPVSAVNRHLVEQLGKRRGSFSGLLHPVHITFDNSQSPTDTIMDIRSDDTPAFLYAFANALAMRDVYIAKARNSTSTAASCTTGLQFVTVTARS